MMRGISRRKRVSCPDTTRNPQEPSAVTEAEPSRKRAATSETFRDASEGQLVQDEVPPAYENDLENKDLSEEVQLEEADAENAVESAHATKEGMESSFVKRERSACSIFEARLSRI